MIGVTRAESERIYAETYEEMPPDVVPVISRWVELVTGWMPLLFSGEFCILPWNVVLEHGRRYVRYRQNHYSNADQPGYIDAQVKLVGGNFP